jgi:hypothetical protein
VKLVIEPADNQHPLSKKDMEEVLREIQAEGIPPGVQISLREREPGVGELASIAHLWQLVVDLVTTGAGTAAAGHLLNKTLPPVLKYFETREQAKVKVKTGGVTLEAPAHMSPGHVAALVDRVVAASGKAAPVKSPAKSPRKPAKKKSPAKGVTTPARKKAAKKAVAKRAAKKRTRS